MDLGISGRAALDGRIEGAVLVQARGGLILQSLAAEGVRVAIDDFGAGYSSLSRLEDLPLDTLKIDRAFVMGLPEDESDKAIVSATVAMARALKLAVVAEGVEKQGQFELLRDRDCDLVQGYWLGYPVSADAFARLLD